MSLALNAGVWHYRRCLWHSAPVSGTQRWCLWHSAPVSGTQRWCLWHSAPVSGTQRWCLWHSALVSLALALVSGTQRRSLALSAGVWH
ncbi:MAG: hypothetical protein LBK00_03585, partial [Treponema sp.]|nr:hypothetical protein [Treponema sp.]